MHQKAQTRATRCRVQNVLFATLALAIVSGFVGWRGLSSPVLAKPHDVPFRFMESTILETQAALEAAPSRRNSWWECIWRGSRHMTIRGRPSMR